MRAYIQRGFIVCHGTDAELDLHAVEWTVRSWRRRPFPLIKLETENDHVTVTRRGLARQLANRLRDRDGGD